MASHIHAFTIVVPDYDAGLDFYNGTLGWEVVQDTQLGPAKRWVLVRPPGAETSVLLARADGADQTAAIGRQAGGRVAFFLHTDDFEADHSRMCAAGVRFEEPPRYEPYGTVAVFADPFGNRWDLLQLKG